MTNNQKFSGPSAMFELNPYEQHKYQMHQLGAIAETPNGDKYRYAVLGADVHAGLLITSVLGDGAHHNCALSAAVAIGATEIKPTIGATAVTAAMFNEGTVVFNDVAPEGYSYEIIGHSVSAAGSEALTVKIAPSMRTAATVSSQVSLIRNPWNLPIATQHILTVRPCGVSHVAFDVSEAAYGWLKTRGVVSCLTDTTGVTIGLFGCIGDAADGTIGLISDADQEQPIAQFLETGTATEYNGVYLFID